MGLLYIVCVFIECVKVLWVVDLLESSFFRDVLVCTDTGKCL